MRAQRVSQEAESSGKASSGDSLIQEKWDMKERETLTKPQRFQLKQQVGWSFIIMNWTHLWEGPGGKGNWSSVWKH